STATDRCARWAMVRTPCRRSSASSPFSNKFGRKMVAMRTHVIATICFAVASSAMAGAAGPASFYDLKTQTLLGKPADLGDARGLPSAASHSRRAGREVAQRFARSSVVCLQSASGPEVIVRSIDPVPPDWTEQVELECFFERFRAVRHPGRNAQDLARTDSDVAMI